MRYPALDIDISGTDNDLLLALLDDFAPSAIDDHQLGLTVFFSDGARRDQARDAVVNVWPDAAVSARDVDDENWARRSQENLEPITVGRITVLPPWRALDGPPPESQASSPQHPASTPTSRPQSPVRIVIAPSMGFGTGHHATTRLCLAALQKVQLTGQVALDVGTGSGVLAIAARLLGAHEAIGIDVDPDAVQAATENVALNSDVEGIRLIVGDLRTLPLPRAGVVTANLTGALLVQTAPLLAAALAPGGTLIVSGLMASERDEVIAAFPALHVRDEAAEDGWLGLAFNRGGRSAV